jgi:microcystin-dependent protein
MKGIIRARDYFFQITATAVRRGSRFKNGDRPSEQTFLDQITSSIFKSEASDRAKEDATGAVAAEVSGHTRLSTDAQAKAGTSKGDISRAVQPSQLPTSAEESEATMVYGRIVENGSVDESENVIFDNEKTILIEEDSSTNNAYRFKWTTGVIAFFNGMGASLKDLSDRVLANATLAAQNAVLIQGIQTDVGGNYDQLLPIGSTTFNMGTPGIIGNDPVWQPMDGANGEGLREVSPGVPSTIYQIFDTGGYDLSANGPTGATHFLLPTMNYRIPMGLGASLLGNQGGTDWRTTIIEGNLPIHSHAVTGTIDPEAGSTHGAHKHGIKTADDSGADPGSVSRGSYSFYSSMATTDLGKGDGSHSHTFAGSTDTFGAQNQTPIAINPPTFGGTWYVKVV